MQSVIIPTLNIPNDPVKKYFSKYRSIDDPEAILEDVTAYIGNHGTNNFPMVSTSEYKAASLFEFNNGVLLSEAIPDKFRTLAIDMSRRLQSEHNCTSLDEKALAEIAALNYVRILDLSERIQSSLLIIHTQMPHHDSCFKSKDPFYAANPNRTACQRTALELKLLNILNKGLDDAHKAYSSAFHSLHALHQQPLQVNIKTQNTIVGQNQLVQANSNE